MLSQLGRIVTAFLGGCILFTAMLADGQSNLVLLISAAGDSIGAGQTYYTTNQSNIVVSGIAEAMTIQAFGFTMILAGPGQSPLTVGQYSNAVEYPSNGTAPGLSVFGNGQTCTNVCGYFQIYEFQTNGSGQVVDLWATFLQQCECGTAPLTGEIRYNSQLAPATPLPRVLHVPGDFSSIQSAINDVSSLEPPDEVLVAPGTYGGNITFNGKALTLESAQGPGATILDGSGVEPVIAFTGGEGSNSILSGFTIQNGTEQPTAGQAGGVTCTFASPTIVSNIIWNNVEGAGPASALYGNGSSAFVSHNYFENNSGSDVMLFQNDSLPVIVDNIFFNNSGIAVHISLPAGEGAVVLNNTVVSNSVGIQIEAYNGVGGIYANNLLADNTLNVNVVLHNPIYQFYIWANNLVSGSQNYSGIADQTGTNGNLEMNPFLACEPSGDFHLLSGSPCTGAGTNLPGYLPGTDFDGLPRTRPGASNGVPVVDIGAYQFDVTNPPSACLFLNCPTNMLLVLLPGQTSTNVLYPMPFATPGALFSNTPPPGSAFPVGEDPVYVWATYGTNILSCGFDVTVLASDDYATALGTTNLAWSSGGDVPWFIENALTHDSVAAAQSGTITNNQISTLQTTMSGPAKLSFWWMVSSATNHGFLSLEVNGAIVASLSGHAAWSQQTVYLGAGPQTVQWTYAMDASASVGSNSGWLDSIAVSPGATSPVIVSQPTNQAQPPGYMAAFSVSAIGTPPLNYQWYFNGTNLPGATAFTLVLTNVQATNFGIYSVVVSNSFGSTNSAEAMLTLGEVLSWGTDLYGETNVPLDLTNVLAISGGWYHSMALTLDGIVVAWGRNNYGQTEVPAGLTNVVAISSRSGNLSMALRTNGTVVVWGDNAYGQTNVPAGLRNVVAIAAGGSDCLALKSDGTVVQWGQGGQPPSGLSNVVAVAAGDEGSLALKPDGTIVGWGGLFALPGLTNITAIAEGGDHALALKNNGTVVAWGNDSYGQTSVPAGLSNVVAIGAGDYHSVALKSDGTVVDWGSYASSSGFVPAVTLPSLTNVVAIAAGSDHDLAIVGSGPPIQQQVAVSPNWTGGNFSASIPTQSGRTYRLESCESLITGTWVGLELVAGTGFWETFTDTNAAAAERFYRVRRW